MQNLPPLKEFQKTTLFALNKSKHVICISPTGSGKSRIFQQHLLENPNLKTILFSPLNALARQHEQQLKQLNIVTRLGIGSSAEGPPSGAGVWIVNPEQVSIRKKLNHWVPDFLIVDEAHCVWEWGENFRPQFKNILKWVSDWQVRQSLWLSATLPSEARREIETALPKGAITLGSFSLPENIKVQSHQIHPGRRVFALVGLLENHAKQLGVIFVSTRESAERLAVWLRPLQKKIWIYHAGLSSEERIANESEIREAKHGIVISTSAFGMGMDISQIHFCILYQPSFSLLALAQAIGRTGRSGDCSKAYVLWDESDFLTQEWAVRGSHEKNLQFQQVHAWCRAEGDDQNGLLLNYFNVNH